MSKINLLPWREELRKEANKQFSMSVVFVALIAGIIWGLIHFYHVQLIDFRNVRIAYVDGEIKNVDAKIEEIQELEKEKENLLSRMNAIEQLQGNRPLAVRLFDELITSLPEGVTIKSITQNGTNISIEGLAESNARVSSFMRSLEKSDWFKGADLKVIREFNVDRGGTGKSFSINSFELTFAQEVPILDEEGGDI